MAKLVSAVFVRDPDRHVTVVLRPGEEPEPRLAALVTAPDAWEDGKLPASVGQPAEAESEPQPEGEASDRPAVKKTAARKPGRGRGAASKGDGGE